MWCTSVSGSTVNVINRGMFGTTAAAHTSGTSFVRNAPRYPRESIKRAINDTILSVYPDLFAVATTTLTAGGTTIGYELPAAVREVLELTWDSADLTGFWREVDRYRVNLNANTTDYPSGRSIEIFDGIPATRTVQVVYKREPVAMTDNADVFDTVTLLPQSAKECIIYGACARLFGYGLVAGHQTQAAAAAFMDPQRGSDPLALGRYFYQMHLQARAEEARRLNDRYPPRIHWNR